nr:MAG TPA: hypothetical protein [Caudoviricetes sp.]
MIYYIYPRGTPPHIRSTLTPTSYRYMGQGTVARTPWEL